MLAARSVMVEPNAEIPTWFGVGGRAELLSRPASRDDLRDTLLAFAHSPIRVLGDGANLLVHDDGVDGLVVSLDELSAVEPIGPMDGMEDCILVRAEAGVRLPRLCVDTVRDGLAGLEVLAGIPASVGGAAVMNAGGRFGSIADVVHAVHGFTRSGEPITIPYQQLSFDYRHSGLSHLIITAVDLALRKVDEGEQPALRDRLKEVMAAKKASQPLAERSAGCVFKNPMVDGVRMSAGRLIDLSNCKGMKVGGASVSEVHANFVTTGEGCRASDILELMEMVAEKVRRHWGVTLEPEVAVWRR